MNFGHNISPTKKLLRTAGFTLIELMVTISIFAFLTAFLAIKYGNSSQALVLTNLAYDVALTIRQAQSYGLNVKEAPQACIGATNDTFQCAYGLYVSSSPTNNANQQFLFYNDINGDSYYDITAGEEAINTYLMKHNIITSKICTDEACTDALTLADVSIQFRRPNPTALLNGHDDAGVPKPVDSGYVKIQLQATDGTTKNVVVRSTGQISIED